MAKVLATEIRAGHLIEMDKRVWRVLKSYHVHVGGRGGAFMQVEMKDVETGITIMVPQFVSQGEKIKVNTDSGDYIERV